MTDRLTAADLARMRAEHMDQDGVCISCWERRVSRSGGADFYFVLFPCAAASLLAELDRREANPLHWQGRNHLSPVPHLAGVAYGLLGPATTEEIER